MKKVLMFIALFVSFAVFSQEKVNGYYEACQKEVLESSTGTYRKCGNNNIYVMKDNKQYSSYLMAEINIDYKKGKIIYAGEIDGLDTFYSSGFNYFGVIYDERNVFNTKDNIYSDISIDGVVVYSGKIEDNILIDQSKRKYVNFFNEVGTYLIRQFVGSKLHSAIRVIVVNKEDIDLRVDSFLYGNYRVDKNNLPYSQSDLTFNVKGGKYGFGNTVDLIVNECNFLHNFDKKLVVKYDLYSGCLKMNETNVVSLVIYDGLDRSKMFKYSFNLLSEKVSIKLEDSVNASVTASRRVLIEASPGIGNKLDESYNLYYWSKNANDKLTYEDFMTNYDSSEYKGTYSSSRGVILRDSEGTYYLYAMAKDDASIVVVRSDEYVLKEKDRLNKFVFGDFLFVIGLCICAVLPIFVYLLVRGKDTA